MIDAHFMARWIAYTGTMPFRPCYTCGTLVEVATREQPRCEKHKKEIHSKYRPERLRQYNDSEYQKNRLIVLEHSNYICFYCLGKATTADHLIPLNKGGTHEICNLVSCCSSCNRSKGTMTIPQWIKSGRAPERAVKLFTW